MTAKLDTAEGVLDWVYEQTRETYAGRSYDTTTASYLAECVRLRQAFDARCTECCGCDEWVEVKAELLRAALEEVK